MGSMHDMISIRGLGGTVFGVVLTVLLASCASEDRDEAADLDPVPQWTPTEVASSPSVRVGTLEGDTLEQLLGVVTPFLLEDGSLAVPLNGARTVRIFDSSGEFSGSLGRSGEGPGEFESIGGAWLNGDTIEVFDGTLSRITRFFPGDSVAIVNLGRPQSAQMMLPGTLLGGWVAAGVVEIARNGRDRIALHRFSRSGEHAGEIARLSGFRRHFGEGFSGPVPLSPKASFVVHEDRLYVAESLVPRIEVLDATGDVTHGITWEPDRSRDPGSIQRAVVDSAIARAAPEEREAVRQRWNGAPIADEVPVLGGLMVDDLGFIWIRPYDPVTHSTALGGLSGVGTGGRWMILTPEGERLATMVSVPHGVEPVRITENALIGVRRDELGVEYVEVYDVERR